MIDVKRDILALVEKNKKHVDLLNDWGGRTNFFTGAKPRGKNATFCKYEGDGDLPCLLTQLYRLWYKLDASRKLDPNSGVLEFECLRYDCCFLADRKTHNTYGYPESWEYDWFIEVENDFEREFVMTQMGLLDLVCNHRLTIFFTDERDLNAMSERFAKPWQTHVARHPFVKEFDFSALLLPTSFDSVDQYSTSALQIRWNAANGHFDALA